MWVFFLPHLHFNVLQVTNALHLLLSTISTTEHPASDYNKPDRSWEINRIHQPSLTKMACLANFWGSTTNRHVSANLYTKSSFKKSYPLSTPPPQLSFYSILKPKGFMMVTCRYSSVVRPTVWYL